MPVARRLGIRQRDTRSWATYIASLSPVAWYRFNDSSGSVCTDTQGADNGVYVLSPTLGTTGLIVGDSDKAVTFNGSSQYVNSMTSAALRPARLTIMAWINPSSVAPALSYIGGAGTAGAAGYHLRLASGRPTFNLGDGSSAISLAAASAFVAGTTHLISGTYDGTSARLYVDGVLRAGPTALSAISYTGVTDFYWAMIQAQTGNAARYFSGTIDEGLLFSSALTSDQNSLAYSIGRGLG